jgi:hypothetical protein
MAVPPFPSNEAALEVKLRRRGFPGASKPSLDHPTSACWQSFCTVIDVKYEPFGQTSERYGHLPEPTSIPVALIAAGRDTIVPPRRTEPLRRAGANIILARIIANDGHNDIYNRPAFAAAMAEALGLVLARGGGGRHDSSAGMAADLFGLSNPLHATTAIFLRRRVGRTDPGSRPNIRRAVEGGMDRVGDIRV